MTIGLSRNNPWNLLAEHIPWMGLLADQPDSGPLAFDSMQDGIRAGIKLCYTYQERGWDTPVLFIPRFSPPQAGNPTPQYIENICTWCHVSPDQLLDFHDNDFMKIWAKAIFRQEQGEEGVAQITDDEIMAGIAAANQ
jgi:hypothetical protein